MRRTPRILAAALAVARPGRSPAAASDADDDADGPGAAPPAGRAYPVTVGSVTLDKRPERIVSLSPTATEMLFAIGAGPQVSPSTTSPTIPADAPKTDLSGFKPNAEAIAGKNPDLVVLSDDTEQDRRPADRAEDPGVPGAGGDRRSTTRTSRSPTSARSPATRPRRPTLVHADEGRHRQAGQGRAAARRAAHLLLRARPDAATR